MKYIEKHANLILIIIFFLGILFYGSYAKEMTSICTITRDEELYINMARSFFYDGNFSQGYEIINYNCVIYSIVISIAYLFYSAGNIVTLIRIIGVILIVSSVFPVYFLSKKVLNSKVKALGVAILNLLIPEMALSLYALQEVLLYPLFLWVLYLIYLKFSENKGKILDFAIVFLLATMFFVKSYAIAFGVAYFLTLLIICGKKGIKNIIINGIVFVLNVGIFYGLIYLINDFQAGTNHYLGQITSIFPITLNTIKNFIYGMWYYGVLFLLCTGILPVIAPIQNIKKYGEADKKFVIFLICSTIITIIETALIVFVPEESDKLYPYKICYRYLFVLMIPFFIMFIKLQNDVKIGKITIITYTLVILYSIWYYIMQGTNSTSIDAPVLFVLQYNTGIKLKICLISAYIILAIFTLIIYKRKEIKNKMIIFAFTMCICSIAITSRYLISSLNISNNDMAGNVFSEDFVKIVNNIQGNYDKIYISNSEKLNCHRLRAIGPMFSNGYKVIEIGKEIDIQNERICIIIPNDFDGEIIGADKIDIGTSYMDVYVSDSKYDKLKVNASF